MGYSVGGGAGGPRVRANTYINNYFLGFNLQKNDVVPPPPLRRWVGGGGALTPVGGHSPSCPYVVRPMSVGSIFSGQKEAPPV
jgi:hypothetical protein